MLSRIEVIEFINTLISENNEVLYKYNTEIISSAHSGFPLPEVFEKIYEIRKKIVKIENCNYEGQKLIKLIEEMGNDRWTLTTVH